MQNMMGRLRVRFSIGGWAMNGNIEFVVFVTLHFLRVFSKVFSVGIDDLKKNR